jgi:hypothetical protein
MKRFLAFVVIATLGVLLSRSDFLPSLPLQFVLSPLVPLLVSLLLLALVPVKGPEVWEVKWAVFWRKGDDGLPGRRHCLIVARHVLTGEVKYFVANRVPGERGITLRWLLRVAFGRWSVERCFRVAKDELGMNHYQVRGWRCLHRHFYLTQASYLFCARIRQQYDTPESEKPDRLTIEQVRSATNTWLSTSDLKPVARRRRYEKEQEKQRYYQRRNRQAGKSHTKTKLVRLNAMGIDVNQIKSCII